MNPKLTIVAIRFGATGMTSPAVVTRWLDNAGNSSRFEVLAGLRPVGISRSSMASLLPIGPGRSMGANWAWRGAIEPAPVYALRPSIANGIGADAPLWPGPPGTRIESPGERILDKQGAAMKPSGVKIRRGRRSRWIRGGLAVL